MGGNSTTKLIDLPIELIEHVFDLLPLFQRTILLHVCRILSHPCFWQKTYHSVSLYDSHQLRSFANTIEQSSKADNGRLLGEYVRQLTLWENLLDTDANTVALLQQQCPEVECIELTIRPDNTYPPTFKIPFDGWCKLTMMYSFEFDDWEESIPAYEQQLQHLVMHKPMTLDTTFTFRRLTHLDFRGQQLIHSLDEMDRINCLCPALQSLHIGDLEASCGYNDLMKVKCPLAIQTCLTHLALRNVYFSDPAMYQVFGQLYPNLVSLKIHEIRTKPISTVVFDGIDRRWRGMDSDDEDDFDEFDDAQFSLLQLDQNGNPPSSNSQHLHTWPAIVQSLNQLMVHLPCLRQLHLASVGVTPYSEDWCAVDEWLQHCAQLEDLRLDWYCKSFKTFGGFMDKRPEPKWQRVTHLLDICQGTIQAWHLFLKQDSVSTQRPIFGKLAQCSWLHTLTVHTTYESDTTLPIDELLACLPHLKSLELRTKFGKDLLSPIEKTAPRLRSLEGTTILPHGLTRFVYIGKLYSSRLVAYVHARCPNLRVLHLDGRQTPSKKAVTLNLPGWRLRELDIGSEFSVGKMLKTVLVQETSYSSPRSRWYLFSRGRWCRRRQTDNAQSSHGQAPANLTINCDYVERCVFKPQDPCFTHAS